VNAEFGINFIETKTKLSPSTATTTTTTKGLTKLTANKHYKNYFIGGNAS